MRYFIELAYHGKHYNGWQIQKTGVSVEEVLEKKLSLLLRRPINIVGAGRTDSRVHAKQMFAHFDFDKEIEIDFVRRLNTFLPRSIKVFNIHRVKNEAHARFDALSRTYKYLLSSGKNPFYEDLSWTWLNGPLCMEKMNEAADVLMHYYDFSSFCKTGGQNKTSICKIYQAHWKYREDLLCFTIEANRFLRNMVRAIVGTLVDVGRGKIDTEDFIKIIQAKDRKRAGSSAPEAGLFLTEIRYPEEIFL
ncbi:MAG: tRNA pseudouridine(38-40) synthase TruA [Flavobacteriales bacterium Tduv]